MPKDCRGKIAAAPSVPEPAAAIKDTPEETKVAIGVNETLAKLDTIKKTPASELEIKPVERAIIPENHTETHAEAQHEACERCCIYRKKQGSKYCVTCEACLDHQSRTHANDQGRTE